MSPVSEDKRDFFISRAGPDSEWAQWIAQELEKAGYGCYLQDWDFLPGQSFVECMRKGAEYDCTLLVMSPSYWKPDIFTHPEWQAAFAKRRFIPVRVEKCEIPALLSHYIYIDIAGKPPDLARQALLAGVKGERLKREVDFPGESGDARVSIAKLPAVNRLFIGRDEELKQLNAAWPDAAIRLVSIVAFGGVGKTSLAVNWWHRHQAPGAKRVLGWSFYSQGAAENRQASADPFLDYALREWFGMTNPPPDSWARGEKLAEYIRRERTLLILDGLEPLQLPPGPQIGRLKDPGMVALLKELSAHNPGLCVCTSRLPLTDLEDYGNAGVLAIDLDNLTPESGGLYLGQLGVQGSKDELQQASTDFDNHALALTLLGSYLVKRRSGDVRKRDTIPSLFGEPKKGGQARRILRQYEELFQGKPELDVLRILGLFDRPADKGALRILRRISEDRWAGALENLAEARLVQYKDSDGPLDCHPLVREHFAERSVDAADRSSDEFFRLVSRAKVADALHQSGDFDDAARLFEEAEKMQAEWRPDYPTLFSLRGYQYCELLLAQGRKDEVLRRAVITLQAGTSFGLLLDIALDHLSLGRAHSAGSDEALGHLNQAVRGLRRAGEQLWIARSLLARAAQFRHTGEFDKAQHDLDEVRILAARCGMRLFLADYHLEQARLFMALQKPEDARPHYESAKLLIEETGYHRRDPELAELETMLNMKPASA